MVLFQLLVTVMPDLDMPDLDMPDLDMPDSPPQH
jgi:hypothetical protein